jgi:DNA (cytosine-5)-methyltransferase 1
MTHGSLFSGIGGFDLAAQWMGWTNVFHCEWNEFGQKVLKYYWPDAELFTDITKSDFTKYANKIDILTGGFPCQPYSTAGKRLGKEDERHLWPEMLRAIREIQPRWVVGENVRGLTNWNGGMVFDEVQADLEAQGYEILPFLLPACAVNAPHRRDRIWFIAHTNRDGRSSKDTRRNESQSKGEGLQQQHEVEQPEEPTYSRQFSSDTGNQGLQGSKINGGITSIGQERNEQFTGLLRTNWQEFPTQSPLCNGNDGLSTILDTETISFSKWRNESIRAAGNAIVPQVVFEIFKAIEKYELLMNSSNADSNTKQIEP